MSFSFFEVLIIIGITQGFVITGLIWLGKKRSISKLLLSFVLVVFNLLCFKILLHTTGLWNVPAFRYLPLAFELLIQPLIWLYISSLVKPDFVINRRHFKHFIPCAISFMYSMVVYLAVLQHQDLEAKDAIANRLLFNEVKEVEDYLSILSSSIYWFLGLKLVLRYRSWLYNNTSNTDYPTYSWLRNISALMALLIILLTLDILLDYLLNFGSGRFIHWQVFFVYLAALIYYLGLKGFQISERVPALKKIGQEGKELIGPDNPDKEDLRKPAPIAGGYVEGADENKISIEVERAQEVKQAIISALETKEVYLDPELNLQKLSKEIGISPNVVSVVINKEFQKSFRNLINEYRVSKVKDRLKQAKTSNLTILGIAYECGFNSEASFYRIFKAVEGITPKEYVQSLKSEG